MSTRAIVGSIGWFWPDEQLVQKRRQTEGSADRKRATGLKVEGRKSYAEMDAGIMMATESPESWTAVTSNRA